MSLLRHCACARRRNNLLHTLVFEKYFPKFPKKGDTGLSQRAAETTKLRVAIAFPATRSAQPVDGRIILVVSNNDTQEPRFQNDVYNPKTQLSFGIDVNGLKSGQDAVIDDRYKRTSTILASQIPVADWHERFAAPTLSDAIMDRVVHNAYRLEITGKSMRKRKSLTQSGHQDL